MITTALESIASSAIAPGIAAPLTPPFSLLVLDKCQEFPECPFEVAKTDGSTVTVFIFFVTDVVANVVVVDGFDSEYASVDKKTRAKPGAGTWT